MKRFRMNAITALIIITVFLFGLLILFVNWTFDLVEEEKVLMESHIGDTLIIKQDTLIVLDYSMFLETYTLSNSIKVSRKAVEK